MLVTQQQYEYDIRIQVGKAILFCPFSIEFKRGCASDNNIIKKKYVMDIHTYVLTIQCIIGLTSLITINTNNYSIKLFIDALFTNPVLKSTRSDFSG